MLDTQIFFFLNALVGQSAFLDQIITFCGRYLPYGVLLLFIALLILRVQEQRTRIALAVTAGLAVLLSRGVITEAIRYVYHRPRPFSVLDIQYLFTDSAWSFPSGHATFFFALSTVVWLYNRGWGIVFGALSLLIVLGRVIAGVHYPSDIAAGAIIGVATGFLVHQAVRRYLAGKPHQTY